MHKVWYAQKYLVNQGHSEGACVNLYTKVVMAKEIIP